MREVAVVSFAQSHYVRRETERNEVEILMPVISDAIERSGIPRKEIGFTVSGSCDYLAGQPFAFVNALDAVGAWPPIRESHVEMDGAWALYEAWVRLQCGDIDSALVYAFGKSSLGDVRDVMTLQLDPYCVAPLWPDAVSVAALQARALLDSGRYSERDFAEVAGRSRADALANPAAQLTRKSTIEALLAEPYVVSPLRTHACPPISDGAAAVVLAAGDLARSACPRPAWIRGIDHRIEPASLGVRDLTRSPSTTLAGERAGVLPGAPFDIAELHAPFAHQELILRDALALDPGVRINPSGGALAANAIMVAGLARIGESAQRIIDGDATRALAHATSGPCLQQNLVCVLEAA
ncbi:MAG: thiolase domain-containing protein [Chloroflexota bacterium]|nr:thiolase domain-containing protein [Chloroflexota bacterium]